MFLGALISRLIGMQLPGKRALLMKESLEFKKPVHIGDTVRVEGIIARASAATHIIELDTRISVGKVVVATGQVHAQVRDN
jgi:acyl dehydratase